jgi:hypothetical protein
MKVLKEKRVGARLLKKTRTDPAKKEAVRLGAAAQLGRGRVGERQFKINDLGPRSPRKGRGGRGGISASVFSPICRTRIVPLSNEWL